MGLPLRGRCIEQYRDDVFKNIQMTNTFFQRSHFKYKQIITSNRNALTSLTIYTSFML